MSHVSSRCVTTPLLCGHTRGVRQTQAQTQAGGRDLALECTYFTDHFERDAELRVFGVMSHDRLALHVEQRQGEVEVLCMRIAEEGEDVLFVNLCCTN
jgi:hypothetical protein